MTTALATSDYTPERVALLKRTVCKGATDDEFALFVTQCQRTGLDPFARQIHAVKRWDSQAGREVMAIQTGIDGYRLIAERTGLYAGNDDPVYDREDADHPNKATVTVWKMVSGQRVPFTRSARWNEFKQTKKGGELTRFWKQMPYLMLGKVAEALALRAAFPQELSGIYTHEEMQQAGDSEAIEVQAEPVRRITEEAPKELPAKPVKTMDERCDEAIAAMRDCKSLDELGGIWGTLDREIQKAVYQAKDAIKAKLSRPIPNDVGDAHEPPDADHATGDGEPDDGAYIGRAMAESILELLNKLGIDWSEVRDNFGPGRGLADAAGFQAMLDVKVTDLSPTQGQKLYTRLKEMAAKPREKVGAK